MCWDPLPATKQSLKSWVGVWPVNNKSNLPLTVIVGSGEYAEKFADVFRESLSEYCRTFVYPTPLATEAAFYDSSDEDELFTAPVAILVAIIGENTDTGDDILLPLMGLQIFKSAQVMVLSETLEVSGVEGVIEAGRLDWIGYAPGIEVEAFVDSARAQIRRFNQYTHYQTTDRIYSVFDQPYTDDELITRIMERIESALGTQPRVSIPEGTTLTTPGHWVEEVTIVLEGSVALLHETPYGGLVMHEQSTGRIVGLLALSEGRRASLAAVTTSDVIAIRLTIEQMNSAIDGHPDIILLLATLFIRSLDRRLRRAEELHIENAELSEQLDRERAQLAKALENLEQARTELMAQQRLASLGELAAGMAHELNNPTAAIERTVDHLGEDIIDLIQSAPDRKWTMVARTAMRNGLNSKSLSTSAERKARRELTAITGDAATAQRLVLAGVRDPQLARQIKKNSKVSLDDVETAASIGVQLRNLRSASKRISDLVTSLRSYARPDGDPVSEVDLHENLDDAIRLLSHKLTGIDVRKDYSELPVMEGHPGELAQVWTNVIANAAEAIVDAAEEEEEAPAGRITIRTSELDPDHVRVEIIDNGPGISDSALERIFEPRFTTKAGQVRFGMGLGLGVSRTIIDKHHGTIRIDTSSDGTNVIVDLPLALSKEKA